MSDARTWMLTSLDGSVERSLHGVVGGLESGLREVRRVLGDDVPPSKKLHRIIQVLRHCSHECSMATELAASYLADYIEVSESPPQEPSHD